MPLSFSFLRAVQNSNRRIMMLVATLILTVASAAAQQTCGADYTGDGKEGCFYISPEPHSFVECQEKVCEPMKGTLASIRNSDEEKFVEELVRNSGTQAVFVGYFESGLDESGRWSFVDGAADYSHWMPGQPDELCEDVDEDCAVLAPMLWPEGWIDSSCAQPDWAHCLCREGGEPTVSFKIHRNELEKNEYDYMTCFDKLTNGTANFCEAIGVSSEFFTPFKQPKADDYTCQAASKAGDFTWAWCCCGVDEACCPNGQDNCPFYTQYQAHPYTPVEEKETLGDCPGVFEGPSSDACFFISEDEKTFVECEDYCEGLGGATLASVRSEVEYNYLARELGEGFGYVGGFEAGEDESGDWVWIDGKRLDEGYSVWADGQPDNFCDAEDCLAIAPIHVDGFFDASCIQNYQCVCRFGGQPIPEYEDNKPNLLKGTTDYADCWEWDDFIWNDQYWNDDQGTATPPTSPPAQQPGDATTTPENDVAAYCGKYGFDQANFAPYARAYPAMDPLAPLTSQGYSEGLCGYAAAEDDALWSQCCCDDRSLCCPASKDDPACKTTHPNQAVCPLGYSGPSYESDSCFKVSDVRATFVGCQTNVCGPEGGTVASLRNLEEFAWVRDLLDLKDAAGFVGLFEYGEDESGDWRWVDGTRPGFIEWTSGEPNQQCGVDEDCAVLAPDIWPGLVDASCAVEVNCVCRHGGSVSEEYTESITNLASADPNYDVLCTDDDHPGSYYASTEESDEGTDILDRLRSLQAQVVAILVLFCLLIVAGVVTVFFVIRPSVGFGTLRRRRGRDPTPAFGLELHETGGSIPAYNQLVRDDCPPGGSYVNPRGAII